MTLVSDRNKRIYLYLKNKFPKVVCELDFKTSYQLLVAVILSAQCTDKRVNSITPKLFEKFGTAKAMAVAKQSEIEKLIYSAGFYKNKAKNIISMSNSLINNFNGQVPNDLEQLKTLAGVGRKTANVVYSVAFGGATIAVDTHVFRTSNRLGLADSKKEIDVEYALMEQFEKKTWSELHYMLVLFGRYYCKAKKPLCEECGLKDICKYYNK